ncbi:MAG TPA: phage tail sheath subtilisin-like domain-containing protein, partial [Vicinamibacterales bacterium]|nr:phage tail sheath subtilisin-like domain-containing protein [Vicinamibacterales bacterium]
LVKHAETMRYRIAVLDSPQDPSIDSVRRFRTRIDSSYGALYYPWLSLDHDVLPPSGFICGIYARHDAARGVFSAPANEPLRGATGVDATVTNAEQDVLNQEGINVIRAFPERGILVWGARTTSSDAQWKYVNIRRLLIFLEHSIDKGTQWAAFEPNGDPLWANIRRTIEDFLADQWRAGALLGSTEDEAFVVRCDRTTMTQDDLDNGRLVCLVGVAPVRPAEFVIFRIGQWTADARC